MPKETTKKNTKDTKATASKKNVTKKAPAKKTTTKVEAKNATPKKVEAKKVTTKKTETKKVPAKNVETNKVVKEVVKPKKGKNESKINAFITKTMDNTPLVIALCVIVLLVATLIFMLCIKRVPKTSDGSEIIATINGKEITADELYNSLKESYGSDSLVNLIDTYIADKEIEITEEDEKYAQEVVDYYKEYADYYGVDLSTFLSSYVGLNGITTEDEFFDYVLEDYKKTLVVTNYIGENAKEEDLKKHYEKNFSDKLTVKHILIEVDPEAEDKEKADKEAYDKAVDIIEELNDTDAKELDDKFKELAEDNSDDTATYSNGGLIENFVKSDVVEEFWNASEKLKDGKYTSEPVKSSYGYHVILKVSSTPVEKYKDIKDEVKKSYAESLLAEDSTLFSKKWAEIRKEYKLSIKDDFIKKLYNKTIKELNEPKEETETEE